MRDSKGQFVKTHAKHATKEYNSWSSMKKRALGKEKRYAQYVPKGIDPRWLISFQDFLNDMGNAPSPKHTLERIDNSKGYFPWNCKWATSKEQTRNYSSNRVLEFNGEKMCVTDWAEKLKISRHLIYHRLNKGWSIEKALTTPKMPPFGIYPKQ
jgi:hypothetical protein